jgi:hypothetical protein
MSLRAVLKWIGVMAQLYVLFVLVFYGANVAAIIAIRGLQPLNADVLRYLFVRDAFVCIPITIIGTFVYAFLMRRIRTSIDAHRRH